jgi:hypothetical protein
MPTLDRLLVLSTACAALLCGCDLFDKDKDDGNAEGASMDDDGAADDGEDSGEDDSGGDDGSGGGGGGTGEPLTACQQCAAVNCEEETMPCATDDICQECVWDDPSAEQCDTNEAWQEALACACDVCPDACTDLC